MVYGQAPVSVSTPKLSVRPERDAFSQTTTAGPISPGPGRSYRLTGASLVHYRGSPAALVTYEKESQTISLLVASSRSAVVVGENKVRFGNLTFHHRTDDGFKVITWSNHGLSYGFSC
jgi:hypothetical protein